MKKFIFFVLFIAYASFVNAQSSQSIGLKYGVLYRNIIDIIMFESSVITEYGIVYNYFATPKHGIVAELNTSRMSTKFDANIFGGAVTFNTIEFINYNATYSLHYIFKPNQLFIKSGVNANITNVLSMNRIDDKITETLAFNTNFIKIIPEFHLGLGYDFDLGKVSLRINGFFDAPIITESRYLDYGGELGVFYKFSTKED
jgi:hypothetical protein